eukprot:1155009-Pelagomonas_calceolata.AAC.3
MPLQLCPHHFLETEPLKLVTLSTCRHPKYSHSAFGNFRSIKEVAKALGLQQVAKGSSGTHAKSHGAGDTTGQQAEGGLQQPAQEHRKRQQEAARQDNDAHSIAIKAPASASVPLALLPHTSSCCPSPADPGSEMQGVVLLASTRDLMLGEAHSSSFPEPGAATMRLQFESIIEVLDHLSSLDKEKKGIAEQLLLLQGRAEVAQAELQEATSMMEPVYPGSVACAGSNFKYPLHEHLKRSLNIQTVRVLKHAMQFIQP